MGRRRCELVLWVNNGFKLNLVKLNQAALNTHFPGFRISWPLRSGQLPVCGAEMHVLPSCERVGQCGAGWVACRCRAGVVSNAFLSTTCDTRWYA